MDYKGHIEVVENAAYITQTARTMRKEFPTVLLDDIISELTLLILEYQSQYDPEKGKVTTFIAKYPARKLRQVLIYKYLDFTYNDRDRVFVEMFSINAEVSKDADSSDYLSSLQVVEANENNEYSSSLDGSSLACEEMLKSLELSSLDDREKNILIMRFGLDGNVPMTLEQIGEKLDITRERVRVIEGKAKEKLKKNSIFQEMC